MTTTLDFPSTRPDPLTHAVALPANMQGVVKAMDKSRTEPIISLADVLVARGFLDIPTVKQIRQDDPDLLRSRSFELVESLRLTIEELHQALAHTAGLVEVDVLHFGLDTVAVESVPLRVRRDFEVLPLGFVDEMLCVASWCPTNLDLLLHLQAITGRGVKLVWADRAALSERLSQLDPQSPARASEISRKTATPGQAQPPQDQHIEDIMAAAVHELATGQEPEETTEANESSSMVRLVKRLILDAQTQHASDIHIETNPGEQFTRIRLRRDGDLELYQKLPPALRAPLVSRIKVMARLDIAERRRPQDGKINFAEFGGENLELRVAIMPTHDGMEDVVMRLLSSSKPIPLSHLGLQARDTDKINRMSSRSFGLILAVGPTGSGKTTTLHSMLAEINTDDKKIWTAEDPIEITHPGLRQVQVNSKIGLTFASAMRGFLRSDPDVIMIGEIRDEETAKIAIEASLTGHLVLSTLHTNSASESVVRLLDLGMDAMNFADSLVGIVAQRLVRALCSHCATTEPLTAEQWDELVKEYVYGSPLTPEQGAERLLQAADVQDASQIMVKHAQGCPRCSGKGYKGRMGIYEILENSPNIRALIQRRARPTELFDEAVRNGMRSLRHDALEKWVLGKIDQRQARAAYI